MDIKVLSSEQLFQGRVFNLWRDKIELPDGRVSGIEYLQHGGAVTILPVDNQGRIWFVRQYRHPTGGELLELPAGTIEAGEEPAACAGRELREEIGMAAGKLTHLGEFFLAPGYSSEYMHVFMAQDLYAAPLKQDTGELIWIERFTIDEVWQMVKSGEMRDAKTLAILALARDIFPPV